eukprot:2166435-Alexandrium_andersonii.AAC.1
MDVDALGKGKGKKVKNETKSYGKSHDKDGKSGKRKGSPQGGKSGKAPRFEGECFTCGKWGHRSSERWRNANSAKGQQSQPVHAAVATQAPATP